MAQHGGKRANSGRKSKAEEFGLAALLDKVWTDTNRAKVIRNLHRFAVSKTPQAVSAASLLFAYAYGKPTERHELSNPDGSALLQPVAEAITKIYGAAKSR